MNLDWVPDWMNAARYLLASGIAMAAATLLLRILPVMNPKTRLRYLYLTLTACLIAPFFAVQHDRIVPLMTPNRVVQLQFGEPFLNPRVNPVEAFWNVLGMLPRVLLMVALLRILWLLAGYLRLAFYRSRAELLLPLPDYLRVLRLQQRLDSPIYVSRNVSGPVTFGFANPAILLPEPFLRLAAGQQRSIVCHELVHVRRNDPAAVVGEEILRCFLWFHPGVWWMLNRIRLCREQVVDEETIAITGDRQTYLETLLDFAETRVGPVLAGAAAFFERRCLLERVKSIVKEVKLSNRRKFANTVAVCLLMPCALALSVWLLPLHGQDRVAADTPGVSVAAPYEILHRTPVDIPLSAAANSAGGQVVVSVTLNGAAEVIDARVVSGPEDLRASVLRSVLGWHFSKQQSPPREFELAIQFDPKANRITRGGPIGGGVLAGIIGGVPAGVPGGVTEGVIDGVPGGVPGMRVFDRTFVARRDDTVPVTVTQVDVSGLPESLRRPALEALDLHLGDHVTMRELREKVQAVRRIDQHVQPIMTFRGQPPTVEFALRLSDRENGAIGSVVPDGPALRPIRTADPVYPPLARQARIQGTVRFELVVGPEGTVQRIQLISGHPLLVPAATEAVRQYKYEPSPSEVRTLADVNFILGS